MDDDDRFHQPTREERLHAQLCVIGWLWGGILGKFGSGDARWCQLQ